MNSAICWKLCASSATPGTLVSCVKMLEVQTISREVLRWNGAIPQRLYAEHPIPQQFFKRISTVLFMMEHGIALITVSALLKKGTDWLTILQVILRHLECTSWMYREGKTRSVYVLETKAKFLYSRLNPSRLQTRNEKIAYIREFFDAEGSIPQKSRARFYIQLVQSNREKLNAIKQLLASLGITVGKIHQPSRRVDPRYWRMFVRAQSYQRFLRVIGSWHPRKIAVLKGRVKI